MLGLTTKKERQLGVGLVELMVALAVGLFMMAGILTVFVESKQTYRESDAVGRLQENARYAFELLSRDLRSAGYQGCMGNSVPPKVTVNHDSNAGSSYAWDFTRNAVEGFDAIGTSEWSSVSSGNPVIEVNVGDIDANVLSGTDVISMRGIDSAGISITGQPSSGTCLGTTADLKVSSNETLKDFMVVMVTNCTHAAVLQITNFNSSQNVVHNLGVGSPGNSTKDLGACFVGGELAIISAKSYFIRNNSAGEPALYRKVADGASEELVEGVENMQILYGEDTGSDSSADIYRKADSVSSWDKVVSIQISLLVRGNENNVVTAPQAYQYNGSNLTAPDRRIRQVYTSTVSIRNRAY